MSAELNIAGSMAFLKAGASVGKTFQNALFDVSGNAFIQNSIVVGTSDETLALGDVTTIGWVYMRNLDATNYCTSGGDGTLYNIKMKPGEPFFGRWNGAAIHVKFNTAPGNFEYLIISD